MRICTLWGTEIRCGPLFMLLCLAAGLSGNIEAFLTHLLAVLLHELAHGVMAGLLGYRVAAVELLPYGCAARIPRLNGWFDELMIAMAGPVFSGLAAMGCRLATLPWTQAFAAANMYIAAINMLPVFPLDGGRAARSLLKLLDIHPPRMLRIGAAVVVSAITAAAGWAGRNATVLIFAAFMLCSAFGQDYAENSAAAGYMRQYRAAYSGAPLEMRHVALWQGVSLNTALASLGGSRYVMVWVLDENMSVVGRIEGLRLMELAAERGGEKKLRDVLASIDRGMVKMLK